MTTCPTPATGANSSVWYVEETTCGVTPDNPEFKLLRRTSGNMQLTKDALESNELDGSRDRADVRLGQNQATGEIAFEMSSGSHDDFYAAALGASWFLVPDVTGVDITVDATAKTFTRASGDFTTNYSVGSLVKFVDLQNGNNSDYQVVTALTATVMTCANAVGLENESLTTNIYSADFVEIDDICTSYTILEHFPDLDSGNGGYTITRGVKVTAFSFNMAVNANNTGSFTLLGLSHETNASLPAGTTFAPTIKSEVYSGVDGTIFEGAATLGYVNSVDMSLDTEASAQYALGDSGASFIEQGRVLSSLSLATFFTDFTLLQKFVNETETKIELLMTSPNGAMLFTFPRVVYTSGAPEVGGAGSITQSLEAMPLQTATSGSSIKIQRLAV